MPLSLLLPVLMIQAPMPALDAVEVTPGLFIHRSAPRPGTYEALKVARITHVIDVRRDGEPGMNSDIEMEGLARLGILYSRYTVTVAPPKADFEYFRTILRGLPSGSRVLVHCGDGNRASALVCAWLIMDRGFKPEQATKIAHNAGLRRPDTEAALQKFLSSHGKG